MNLEFPRINLEFLEIASAFSKPRNDGDLMRLLPLLCSLTMTQGILEFLEIASLRPSMTKILEFLNKITNISPQFHKVFQARVLRPLRSFFADKASLVLLRRKAQHLAEKYLHTFAYKNQSYK